MAGLPLQQQRIDEDYELWDPKNREDTRKGKGFVYLGGALGIGAVGYMAMAMAMFLKLLLQILILWV